MPPERRPAPREVRAFAPGRVNLIGEHTDYNGGLALPFAIAEGVTVRARASAEPRIHARALDLGEEDELALGQGDAFALGHGDAFALGRDDALAPSQDDALPLGQDGEPTLGGQGRRKGWRAFVRGVAAELGAAGVVLPGAELEIRGDVPRGAGLSSSAALAVALGSALLGLAHAELDRLALAELCSRVENRWVGARTGLLDQLASLFGEADTALCIDFSSLAIDRVPLVLRGGWRLATIDSGERRELAASGYNERRGECAQACALLGVESLRQAREGDLARLPATLARRVRHVLEENARVQATVMALRAGDLVRGGDAARRLPHQPAGPVRVLDAHRGGDGAPPARGRRRRRTNDRRWLRRPRARPLSPERRPTPGHARGATLTGRAPARLAAASPLAAIAGPSSSRRHQSSRREDNQRHRVLRSVEIQDGAPDARPYPA